MTAGLLLGAAVLAAAGNPVLGLAGDILLCRGVARQLAGHDAGYVFGLVRPALTSADFFFANLESPLAAGGRAWRGKPIAFRADPGRVADLALGNFRVLSLANNHATDYGRAALVEACGVLAAGGIAPVGAGPEAAAAAAPVYLTTDSCRLAFLAFAEPLWGMAFAGPDSGGIAELVPDSVLARVHAARESSDVVVVSLHWGDEYAARPRASQVAFARALIDTGAAVVVGHHPHVLQGLEAYRGGLIAYSLGNLLFDQRGKRTMQSALILLTLARTGVLRAEVVPVARTAREFRPHLAEGDEAAAVLARIAKLSYALGTELAVSAGRATVRLDSTGGRPYGF